MYFSHNITGIGLFQQGVTQQQIIQELFEEYEKEKRKKSVDLPSKVPFGGMCLERESYSWSNAF